MPSYVIWLLLTGPAAWAVWQLGDPEPLLTPLQLGLLLLVLGLLAGLRLGSTSTFHFMNDLIRLNNYLGAQNRDLAQMNHFLLKKILEKQTNKEESSDSHLVTRSSERESQ